MQLIDNKDFTILDDSFNGNVSGIKNAIEALSMFEGKKYILTPGVVELGDEARKVNRELASIMNEVVDEVLVLGTKCYIL